IIRALYRASQAGVEIDMIVRGVCCLRPGVPGLSDRIRVRSVVGRFLEHSRVFHFANGGDDEYWLGSADMMHRNLDRRVEVLVRIDSERPRAQLRDILNLANSGRTACWELQPDGSWRAEAGTGEAPRLDYQVELMRRRKEHAE